MTTDRARLVMSLHAAGLAYSEICRLRWDDVYVPATADRPVPVSVRARGVRDEIRRTVDLPADTARLLLTEMGRRIMRRAGTGWRIHLDSPWLFPGTLGHGHMREKHMYKLVVQWRREGHDDGQD